MGDGCVLETERRGGGGVVERKREKEEEGEGDEREGCIYGVGE